MAASVYAVIANGERLADYDTRAQAEARAAQSGGEVRLLDRRPVVKPAAPAGVEVFLRSATAAERERALAIYR